MTNHGEKFHTARGYEMISDENTLTPSMEDYLEMIYRLSRNDGFARANELAEKLNVQPPSVTKMIQKLYEKKLLDYEKYGLIHLTEKGEKVGKFLLERHNTLKDFLRLLGEQKELQKNVEQIEHFINTDIFKLIQSLVHFFKANDHILQQFTIYRKENEPQNRDSSPRTTEKNTNNYPLK